MPSYHSIVQDEKSTLLPHPIIVEHCCDASHRGYDPERGYSRRRRSGCCATLCRFLFWTVLGVFVFVFVLRHTNRHIQLGNLWGMGSPVEVPVVVAKCPSAAISYRPGELKYTFDVAASGNSNRFYFGQRWARKPTAGSAAHFVQTAGEVVVKAAPAGTVDPVTVDLDVKLSHEELAGGININTETSGLVFESETFLESLAGQEACISVVATISVLPSANVSSFDIDTVALPVELKESLQLVANNIFIHSTTGAISSEMTRLDSEKMEVETTTNSISGSFPLAEFLSIRSVSGDVSVEIEPKDAGYEGRAGTLQIRTASGEIHANTATSSISSRKFITQVHTVSGSVSGTFLLGVASNVNSANGAIDADFYTAGDLANRSCVVTSVSGSINSRIHDDSYQLGTVRGHFQSQTGAVNAHFPAAWEGHIQGETKTGSIAITGDGVRIVKDINTIPGFGKVVIAEKGDGLGNLSTETLNSAISVRFG